MAKEDTSSSVDDETRALVQKGYRKPPSKPASGDKLVRQIEREAEARRDGKGR
jgi:hypothetical protein